jgi:5-hydroxyisourate hydrolase
MSTISTHVLDVSLGKPAAGVPVLIQRVRDPRGDDAHDLRDVTIGAGTTDADGRLRDFLTASGLLTQGVYRLRFDVAEYFRITSRETFYPEIAVLFRVGAAEEHYHVPVLISPFGYTTYRGT